MIDQRVFVSVGDVQIHVQGKDIHIDLDKDRWSELKPLLDSLHEKLKNTSLEPVIAEAKKKKHARHFIHDLMNDQSWFRKALSTAADTEEIIHHIVSLFG